VLKSRRDRVYCGKWQACTSEFVEWRARYCKQAGGSNEFWRRGVESKRTAGS
jgi:hypothetical protein